MGYILKHRNTFSLIGLILSAVATINTLAYQGLQAYRYFTNQSNLLVFIIFIMIYFKKDKHEHFKYLSFITAVSMSITGIVFHLLLTDSVESNSGTIESIFYLNNFHNLMTHTINPIYYVLFYFIFINGKVVLNKFYVGLIHPVIYFIVILGLSPLTNFYPYPFLDISLNGLQEVLTMTILVMLPLIMIFIAGLILLKSYVNGLIYDELS